MVVGVSREGIRFEWGSPILHRSFFICSFTLLFQRSGRFPTLDGARDKRNRYRSGQARPRHRTALSHHPAFIIPPTEITGSELLLLMWRKNLQRTSAQRSPAQAARLTFLFRNRLLIDRRVRCDDSGQLVFLASARISSSCSKVRSGAILTKSGFP